MYLDPREISSHVYGPLQSIDWGSEISGSTVTYSFGGAGRTTTETERNILGSSYTSEGFTAFEKAQFQAVFASIAAVTNLTFRESSYGAADLRILLDTNELGYGNLGLMVPPDLPGAGIGVFNGAFWDRQPGGDLEQGGFSYVTVLHEVLHAMGLAHPHDGGGLSTVMSGVYSPFEDLGDYNLNQGVFTVMTYNSGLRDGGGVGAATSGRNIGYEATPMALDIAVLQEKYGANQTYRNGANTYNLPDQASRWIAIWDAGGKDVMRYGGDRNATLDLRPATLQYETGGGGYLSAAAGVQGGYTIAAGVVIENAQGGNGHDRIFGNGWANGLTGGRGNDVIRAGDGFDTVRGGQGHDSLSGGGHGDTMSGGTGNDTLRGGDGNDLLQGENNNDMLIGGAGRDTMSGGQHDDSLSGGNAADRLAGGAGEDTLRGGDGDDHLQGGDDNDLLNGGADKDSVLGSAGHDRLEGGDGGDTLEGGTGHDTLQGGNGWDRMSGEGGDDRLYGARGNDTLNGGNNNDRLNGGGGADDLRGGSGDDTLAGDAGDDMLAGGAGADAFVFRHGEGRDTVQDFNAAQDTLRISDALLSGQKSGQAVINAYGGWTAAGYKLDFGGGDVIVLENYSGLSALAEAIDIF